MITPSTAAVMTYAFHFSGRRTYAPFSVLTYHLHLSSSLPPSHRTRCHLYNCAACYLPRTYATGAATYAVNVYLALSPFSPRHCIYP